MKNYEKCKAYKIKEPANGICEGENRKKCLNCPACIRYRETLERKIEELDERLGIVLEGQPEIVRCKDCKWGEPTKNAYGEDRIICGNDDTYIDRYITVPADWFCADGERRDKNDG